MIVINYDDADVLSMLTKLHERMGDLGPVMQEIAGYMHDSSEQAFANQRDPVTGDPWPEFSDTTLQLRPDRAGGQLLRDSAQLVGSLMQESDGLSAYYATDKPYAAMHQFGGTTSPRSMILDLLEEGSTLPITLVYGQRTREELYYHDEFLALAEKQAEEGSR